MSPSTISSLVHDYEDAQNKPFRSQCQHQQTEATTVRQVYLVFPFEIIAHQRDNGTLDNDEASFTPQPMMIMRLDMRCTLCQQISMYHQNHPPCIGILDISDTLCPLLQPLSLPQSSRGISQHLPIMMKLPNTSVKIRQKNINIPNQ